MKRFTIITLGCKVNSYESAAMQQILEKKGYIYHSNLEDNDFVLINTCTVTHVSDGKSRQMIRKAILKNPNAIICAAGCYSQLASDLLCKIEGLHIIIGTKFRSDISELIDEYLQEKKQIIKIEESKTHMSFDPLQVTSYTDNTRAFLKIQDGCNNYCSYCIIPTSRGPMRSRDRQEIIAEANLLVANGFKEIVLTGIHTAGYGSDFEKYHFVDLLKDLIKEVKGLCRLRISSIEASEINEEFIQLINENALIVNHLHIPLQSGSDEVLKKMNRKYFSKHYLEVIKELQLKIKEVSITTDIIVGFPGESEENFMETYQLCQQIGFASMHVFPYSKREHTIAATMNNQIADDVKKDRVKRLTNLSKTLNYHFLQKNLEKEVEVLIETFQEETGRITGHTRNFLKVTCEGKKDCINQLVWVKTHEIIDDALFGERIIK